MSKMEFINLRKAIDMGEYDPKYLFQFEEWHKLPRHMQFELIKQALENRETQLMRQWAEIANVLDFRNKPYLKEGHENIQKQLKKLHDDRERLFLEYSK